MTSLQNAPPQANETTMDQPRSVFFYSHTAGVSGAEIVLLSILAGLDRTRFQPSLLSPMGDLPSAAAKLQVPHVHVPEIKARFTQDPMQLLRYAGGATGAMRQLRGLLRHHRPALLHANSIRAGIIASLASTGLPFPVLWHLHDILPENAAGKAIRRLAAAQSRTALVAVSQATADGFTRAAGQQIVRKPIDIVYNSVDTARFRPDSAERARVRQQLGLVDADVAIGVVAQITPRKRQVELLHAFATAQAGMPRAKLIFVGAALFNQRNQDYADLLQRSILDLGLVNKVTLAGKRGDVPAVLNALDILAQNSDREPLGMTLLEAMATKKPVVTTRVDGTPEVVEDGVEGYLTPVEEPAVLMQRLCSLAADSALRDRLGEAGRRTAAARFSPEQQMQRMHALYERLLGQAR